MRVDEGDPVDQLSIRKIVAGPDDLDWPQTEDRLV
jgi:hypothetical protein